MAQTLDAEGDPLTMESYAGIAHGGPAEGRWIRHNATHYRVAINHTIFPLISPQSKPLGKADIQDGEYRWDFTDRCWRWVG